MPTTATDRRLRAAFRHGPRSLRCLLGVLALWPAALLAANDAVDSVDWALYGRTYDNQRYSELRQINVDNVAQLERRWSFKLLTMVVKLQ